MSAVAMLSSSMGCRRGRIIARIRYLPTATQRLDQRGTGHQPAPDNVETGPFGTQRRRLGRDHIEIADGAGLVLVVGELQ